MIRVSTIKKDFSIFTTHPELVYLDSTATALKPRRVIDALNKYYTEYSANVYRGIYGIAEEATAAYEDARKIVADHIHANSADEVIFTRGTTDSINTLVYTIGKERIHKGSEILVSIAEHHSNFVPWQQLAFENEAVLKVVYCDERGVVPLDDPIQADKLITKKTRIVSLFYVSNVLGTINPIKEICANIKRINPATIIIVDAAQAAPSLPINVQDLGCDFLVFSGHKVCGPTGVGVLWGRKELLESMSPFEYGGEMIERVTLEKTTFKHIPQKFEAGTPPIGEAIGLAAALKYLKSISISDILDHEHELLKTLIELFSHNRHIHILGPKDFVHKTGIVSFTHDKIHPHDLAEILAKDSICIRAGHHCAMPLHDELKIPASARASFYIYNDKEDIERLVQAVSQAEKIFL